MSEQFELQPTSAPGYQAFLAKQHPEPEQLDERTFMLSQPVPAENGGIVSSTLCYVFVGADGGVHIVDPGWNTDENFLRLHAALAHWGLDRIDTVIATHMHPDHLGIADRIRTEHGANIALSAIEWEAVKANVFAKDNISDLISWQVPESRWPNLPVVEDMFAGWRAPELLLHDGEMLDLGRPVQVILTPGHSQGGISLLDIEHRRLVTGDQVMPHLNPGLGMGYLDAANPVGDYFESCERLLELDGSEVLPGHGFRFRNLGLRVHQHISHHLRRTRQVAEILQREPSSTVWETARQLQWARGIDNLEGYFLYSALSQTAMHVNFVQDRQRSERWLSSSY